MLPKILLNSRVSGNKYLRGNVLTGRKGQQKSVFVWLFGVFFGVFFLWGVFFFLIAWYKKKKKKTK